MVQARLNKHIPEILPIAGRRMFVTYPGQIKQCKKCFEQGHVSTSCNLKVDWLDYVIKLMTSGSFRIELFEGWKQALTTYRSDILQNWASNSQNTQDLRQVLNFNRQPNQQPAQSSAQSTTSQPQSQQSTNQPPWSGINPWQTGQGPSQSWNPSQNQGWTQPQSWQSGQGRQQGQFFNRGRGRGRGRGRSSQRNFGPNY